MEVVSLHSPFKYKWLSFTPDKNEDEMKWTVTEAKKVIDTLKILGRRFL